MASEIEYKFLVAADTWKPESRGILIRQGIVR
jgi:CYTH domain-containing protein